MATSKSYFELLLSESYANSLHKNNLKVRTDCLRQSVKINSNSNKKKNLSVKIVVALTFMILIIKFFHLKFCPVCNVYNGNIVKN